MISRKKKAFTVVGIGEILWDLLPEGKQLGGAPANFAYHAHCFGARGEIVSAIGDDVLGREIRNKVKDMNLGINNIELDAKHPTGTVSVKLDNQGTPDYTIHQKVAWDYIPWNHSISRLAKKTEAVCFGSLAQRSTVSQHTIKKFLMNTNPDCLRIFDVNLRQKYHSNDTIKQSFKLATILKCNENELKDIAGYCHITGNEERVVKQLITTYNLLLVAVTRGKRGSVLYTPKLKSVISAPSVKVVDTVGAGDAFTAGICMGILFKWPLEILHQKATKLSAFICTQKGAMPLYPAKIKQKLFI
jgi:fructokinase